MRIEFSARAWMLSAATGLVILPIMEFETKAEPQATGASAQESSGEPRMLIERPATRDAISSSKPARSLFPGLFSGKKTEPSIKLPPKQPGDTRSEVQRHLDELYRREGRTAPVMDVGPKPSVGLAQPTPQLPQSSAGEPSGSSPIQQVASNPFKRFFQKITPFRRSKDANDERPDHVEPLPAAARREQLRIQQSTIAPARQPVPEIQEPKKIAISTEAATARSVTKALKPMDLAVPPAPAPPETESEATVVFEVPVMPDVVVESKAAESSDVEISAKKLPEFLPAVELKPDSTPQILSAELSDEPIGSNESEGVATSEEDQLLGNPFPDVSESEADAPPVIIEPAAVVKKGPGDQSSPFNGLKLDTEETAEPEAPVQQTAADSVPLPKLPELPAPAELAAPDDAEPAGRLPEITPAELPARKAKSSGGGNSPHSDKLEKIAERNELTGLKGFCPVALRDSRELKDARPEFQAEFNGKVYNLSSAEAKEKFESEPGKYAPAAGGQDVVLVANEEADREGSLDRAVWYRDRLYLFATSASHEEFVASPSKFAIGNSESE